MSLVWITRAQPGADATAARVRDLAMQPLVEPLLEVRPLPAQPVDLAGIGALAFTSANAVRAFAPRYAQRALPAFVVGSATAAVARGAGLVDVRSADGDVRALERLILAQRGSFEGALLHPGATEPAGELVGALTAAGLKAMRLALYETVARTPGPALFEALPAVRFVLVHSPRGARALADLLAGAPAPELTALCLSPATAEPLAKAALALVASAETPSEAALMELLGAWARSG